MRRAQHLHTCAEKAGDWYLTLPITLSTTWAHPPPLVLAKNATSISDPIINKLAVMWLGSCLQREARPALKDVNDWLSLQRGSFSHALGPCSSNGAYSLDNQQELSK